MSNFENVPNLPTYAATYKHIQYGDALKRATWYSLTWEQIHVEFSTQIIENTLISQ